MQPAGFFIRLCLVPFIALAIGAVAATGAQAKDPCCTISDPKAEADSPQGPANLFLPGYTVYADLSGYALKAEEKKILTQDLREIRVLSIERGPVKSGSDKYIKAEAMVPGVGRRNIWVHYSGAAPAALSALSSITYPWGDERLTEAYLKNRSARRSWFDNVQHLLDPESNLGKRIVAGSSPPIDLIEKEDYFFVVDQENPVPVLNEKGEPTGETLAPGSVVIVNLLRSHVFRGSGYEKAPDLVSPVVSFHIAPTFQSDREISGHLHIASLRNAIRPLSDLKTLEKDYSLEVAALRKRFAQSDPTLTIDQALRQFHDTICTAPGQDQNALLMKWKKFIESKTDEHSRQIALNAQHVDIVTRTVMGESQRQEAMLGPESLQERRKRAFHPFAESCQGDIIALSIRNRAYAGKNSRKLFGLSYPGDFTGVASSPSQFNLWLPAEVERDNFRITSCFYSSQESYVSAANKRHQAYGTWRSIYERTARRMPKVLGLNDNSAADQDSSYLSGLFAADRDSPGSTDEKQKRLLSFTHYYHPGGLPKGDAQEETDSHRSGKVKNGIVKFIYNISAMGQAREYYPIVDGKLIRLDSEKAPEAFEVRIKRKARNFDIYGDASPAKAAYDFEILADGRWRDPGEYFRRPGEGTVIAHLMEQDLEGEAGAANLKKTVLPNGLLPQCFESDGKISASALKQGFEIPLYWFSKEIRNEAADSFNRLAKPVPAIEPFMGGAYYRVSKEAAKNGALHTKEGTPLKITCTDPAYRDPDPKALKKFPEFGGYCDPNIMLMRSM
jgi:hypothetical protein